LLTAIPGDLLTRPAERLQGKLAAMMKEDLPLQMQNKSPLFDTIETRGFCFADHEKILC
jgi:hypothetical protein